MTGRPDGDRPTAAAARAVGWLAVVGAVGSAVMSLSHVDVVPPVAAGFAVGAVLFAAVAVGAFRRRPWAWAAGVAVNGVTLAGAAVPFRGLLGALTIVVTLAALGVLVSRPGREALRLRPG